MTDTQIIKGFFTDSEWDLIYALVESNAQFEPDEDRADYDSIVSKIYKLHQN